MSDEILEQPEQAEPEETPGQEPIETVESETEDQATPDETPAKTFTQEELEAEIGKRLARERRKFERAQAAATPPPPPLTIESKVDPDDFSTTEAYLEALATEKAEAIVAHREQSKSVNQIEEKYQNQIDEAIDRYPDYIQVAHTHKFMTAEMAAAIKSSDIAVELAYHLGTNLKEAERIFKLSPMMQVKELGKLEAKLESDPTPVKKPSSAPTPIKPIQPAKTSTPAYDTTDPRSSKTMSASEWINADRARRAKLMAAKGLK